jgi:hypothetical protein
MISEPTVCLAHTVDLSWIKISMVSKRTEMSFYFSPVTRGTIRCVQNDFCGNGTFGANRAPILHWNSHYLRKDQNEILHDPHHLGVPSGTIQIGLRLCYVWCKLWIYHAPILTLSPNGPKQDFTWPTSPSSSIGCVENDFWAYGTFGANRAPISNQD